METEATETPTQLKMKINYRCELAGRILMLFQDFKVAQLQVQRFSLVTCGLDHLRDPAPRKVALGHPGQERRSPRRSRQE